MTEFLQKRLGSVTGILEGWDRLRFRGTIRMLANLAGMLSFLNYRRVLLKDFGQYALQVSRQVRSQSLEVAQRSSRPVLALDSPRINKEAQALEIAAKDRVKEGLIATITSLESCASYDVRSDREKGLLELYPRYRKCQHIYHYIIHPRFGLMYVRLQTWFPFTMYVGLNGREWLSRQMAKAGIGYLRQDNCFRWIADLPGAQELAHGQTRFDWAGELRQLARTYSPGVMPIIGKWNIDYYWSLEQSEYATDVLFESSDELKRLYPNLVRHAMESFRSPQVMSFLGRRVEKGITPRFSGEVQTDLARRHEGVRVKHWINHNSVKMYDKAPDLLRVETTINDPHDLQSPRRVEGKLVWKRMRKGVCDLKRRQEASAATNRRYLEALAEVQTPMPVKEMTDRLSQQVSWKGRKSRGLNLLGVDAAVLQALGDGKYLLQGFRNRDLQGALFSTGTSNPAEQRRRSGKVTRQLRLLRAHGLIRKVPHTHRYMVSKKGRRVIAALHAIREADINTLTKAA